VDGSRPGREAVGARWDRGRGGLRAHRSSTRRLLSPVQGETCSVSQWFSTCWAFPERSLLAPRLDRPAELALSRTDRRAPLIGRAQGCSSPSGCHGTSDRSLARRRLRGRPAIPPVVRPCPCRRQLLLLSLTPLLPQSPVSQVANDVGRIHVADQAVRRCVPPRRVLRRPRCPAAHIRPSGMLGSRRWLALSDFRG